jgi:hypothetical protein
MLVEIHLKFGQFVCNGFLLGPKSVYSRDHFFLGGLFVDDS